MNEKFSNIEHTKNIRIHQLVKPIYLDVSLLLL